MHKRELNCNTDENVHRVLARIDVQIRASKLPVRFKTSSNKLIYNSGRDRLSRALTNYCNTTVTSRIVRLSCPKPIAIRASHSLQPRIVYLAISGSYRSRARSIHCRKCWIVRLGN